MTALIVAGSAGATPAFVNEPLPVVSTAPSAAERFVLKTIEPFVPAAPWWMWAMLIGVPAGNPDRFTTKVAVPPVTLLFASLVTSKVMVAVPLPVFSAFEIGG